MLSSANRRTTWAHLCNWTVAWKQRKRCCKSRNVSALGPGSLKAVAPGAVGREVAQRRARVTTVRDCKTGRIGPLRDRHRGHHASCLSHSRLVCCSFTKPQQSGRSIHLGQTQGAVAKRWPRLRGVGKRSFQRRVLCVLAPLHSEKQFQSYHHRHRSV